MHLVLARDILPNNTSAIRPILAPSVQQQGRGRAPSSPITDGTDYLSTVPTELGRDYQNPVRTAWTAVRTGLCGTLAQFHSNASTQCSRGSASCWLFVQYPSYHGRDCRRTSSEVLALFSCGSRRYGDPFFAVFAKRSLSSTIGVQKGSGRVVSGIANLIVRQVVSFEFAEFVDRILHGDGILPLP